MCVLVYAEKRKINKKEFENCFENNKDGFGMAWRGNEGIYFKKGLMEVEEAWKFYDSLKIPLGHILHFRKKSTGTIEKEMTHPFIISKTSPLKLEGKTTKDLLFHNGTLRDWETYKMAYLIGSGNNITEDLSDTRLMAIIVARNGRDILHHFPGRFVVFKKDMSYIYGDFEKEKGVWFSNDSYKDKVPYVSAVTTYSPKKDNVKKDLSWHDINNYVL